MKAEYKDKYHNDRSLSIELVDAGNYVGIRSNVGTLLVVLTDVQLLRLADDLSAWVESKRLF